ncbi:MAG: PDGLE domain-containing protein [Candidatus Bipolaricaulia bacterium]
MRMVIIGGLLLAFGLALFLSPFASKAPDGLERVAEDKGFIERAEGGFHSPIPDYAIPGLRNGALATGLAGLAGTLIAFGLASIIGYGLITRRARRGSKGG